MVGIVKILKELVNDKDKEISRLNREIGELKTSLESTDDKLGKTCLDLVDSNNEIQSCISEINFLDDKASTMEDRSMRQNLVFFGFNEETNESAEDCERKVVDLIKSKKLLGENCGDVKFDRVHRLGRPNKPGSDQKSRPRPIVGRLTYYRDKDTILRNGKLLKGSRIRISEQYSKNTTTVHNNLFRACKSAKDAPNSNIEKFFMKYRHAIVFSKDGRKRTVTTDTIKNAEWDRNF